jgi:hypothetical protein
LNPRNLGHDFIASLADERIKLGAMRAPRVLPVELRELLNQAVETALREAFVSVAYTSAALYIMASGIAGGRLEATLECEE